MIILVRHALAVPRAEWDGDDADRPLTPRGTRQADALVALLRSRPAATLLSSPTVRCKATLAPVAAARGLKVKTSRALREGRGDHAVDLVVDAVGHILVCTHGDVAIDILTGLRRLGWPIPNRPRKAKGSVWVLGRERCTYLPPGA